MSKQQAQQKNCDEVPLPAGPLVDLVRLESVELDCSVWQQIKTETNENNKEKIKEPHLTRTLQKLTWLLY